MKYRVTFTERTDAVGEPSEDPTGYLDAQLTDGIVLDSAFVERDKPLNLHNQGVMDEDDSFLSIGTETWEFDIADGREQDFEEAMRNSRKVIEFEVLDTVP